MRKVVLLCDGISDLCLIDILYWIVDTHIPEETIQISAARELIPARETLRTRLTKVIENHDPDLIVCHRDAEAASATDRLAEIKREVEISRVAVPIIRAVPVRMIESWLLFDLAAIRSAAHNGNGQHLVPIPRIRDLESLLDPKGVLFECLRVASNLPPQRLARFSEHSARSRISTLIEDFSPLRALPSFRQFEHEALTALRG